MGDVYGTGGADAGRRATRTAPATPTTWEITCPACRDVIPSPAKGSEFWTAEDFLGKTTVECRACGCVAKIPAAVRR